ncbi:MAG: hypothetical protein RLZZ623_490 [Actinomycetota bacterium]
MFHVEHRTRRDPENGRASLLVWLRPFTAETPFRWCCTVEELLAHVGDHINK